MFNKKKNKHNVCAIVLAAGSGSRMNSQIKKQFIDINGKPLIYYSLIAIASSPSVGEIILVTSEEDIITMQNIVKNFGISKVSSIVPGGETRQQSVYNGLLEIPDTYEFVLVHDGARPFIEIDDIENVIEDAHTYGAATLGVMVKDTIKRIDSDGFSKETLNRAELTAIQTPQVIKKDLFLKGYENTKDGIFTDDTSIVENIGVNVKVTIGNYSNIKITTPEDLIYLEGFDK